MGVGLHAVMLSVGVLLRSHLFGYQLLAFSASVLEVAEGCVKRHNEFTHEARVLSKSGTAACLFSLS